MAHGSGVNQLRASVTLVMLEAIRDVHQDHRNTHSATLVADGRQACDMLTRQPFDIALMDISMPEMDGLAFLRHLGEERHNVGLVIMSAMGSRLLAAVSAAASGAGAIPTGVPESVTTPRSCRSAMSFP